MDLDEKNLAYLWDWVCEMWCSLIVSKGTAEPWRRFGPSHAMLVSIFVFNQMYCITFLGDMFLHQMDVCIESWHVEDKAHSELEKDGAAHWCLSRVWKLNKCFICKWNELWMTNKQRCMLCRVYLSVCVSERERRLAHTVVHVMSVDWGSVICGCNIQESPAAVSPVMQIEKYSLICGWICRRRNNGRGVSSWVLVVKHSHGNDLSTIHILTIVFFSLKHWPDMDSLLPVHVVREQHFQWLLVC